MPVKEVTVEAKTSSGRTLDIVKHKGVEYLVWVQGGVANEVFGRVAKKGNVLSDMPKDQLPSGRDEMGLSCKKPIQGHDWFVYSIVPPQDQKAILSSYNQRGDFGKAKARMG